MQCPSCRNDIPDNQFYCPICRASVYSYAPENARKYTNSRVERAGKRLLEALLFLILIGIGVVLARAIKWNELLNNFLPGVATTTPTPKSNQPQTSQSESSGKRKATEPTATPKEKNAKSPDSTENSTEKKENAATGSKSATQPTPKPPLNDI